MNQILITEKLYITPELKRKKKFYRISFLISIFIIIILASIYVYAEYDKSKNENISQDILSEMQAQVQQQEPIEAVEEEEDVWKIIVASVEDIEEENIQAQESQNETKYGTYTTSNGKTYETVGTIKIPTIKVNYPILAETSVELLKISPCKFYGPNPNEVGNLCIAGHNYRNSQFFSKVPDLVVGDIIEVTDLSGKTIKYSVYDKYVVVPEDTSCTSQLTNGKKVVTLITCTDDNEKRVIVQAKEII